MDNTLHGGYCMHNTSHQCEVYIKGHGSYLPTSSAASGVDNTHAPTHADTPDSSWPH